MGGQLGGGLLGGFAQAYAQGARTDLEQKLAQRKQLAETWLGIASSPDVRPEARTAAIKNVVGLGGLDPHAKIPKQFSDFDSIMNPPAGFGAAAQQPTPPPTDVQFSPELMQQGAAPPMAPGMPLNGAAAGPGGPGPSRGMSLPTPGAAFQPPQYKMNPQDTGQPLLGFGQQAGAAPPPYSPIYSPEELTQQAAQRAGATAQATLGAQIKEREDLIKEHPDWNYEQIELALGHQPQSMLGDPVNYIGPAGEKLPGMRNRFTGQVVDQRGQIVPDAQVFDTPTPFKVTLEAVQAHGGSLADAANLWNNRYSQSSGVMQVPQPDGTIKEVPYTKGSATGRGVIPPNGLPTPGAGLNAPEAKVSGQGTTIGGRIPKSIEDAYQAVNESETRYAVMQDSLPKALAGDQQSQINLLANHLGMTAGLQKGSRITQALWNESAGSLKWWDSVLSRFVTIDPNTGDRIFTIDPMEGVHLEANQMRSMVGLAKSRLDQTDAAYGRLREQVRSGYGMQSNTPGEPAQPKATPQTHRWSKSAWSKANPNGDVAAAEAFAKAQKYEVVP